MCDYQSRISNYSSRRTSVTYVVQVADAFQELLHVALDLSLVKSDFWVVEHAAQIVVHVRHDHVQDRAPLAALAFLISWVLD